MTGGPAFVARTLTRPPGGEVRVWRVYPSLEYVATAEDPTLGRVVAYRCGPDGVVDDANELAVTRGADHAAAVRAAGYTPIVESGVGS